MSIANRWREGGPGLAVYEPSGIAGALLLLGAGATAMGSALDRPGWSRAGLAVLALGTLLAFVGLIVSSGAGLSGVAQAVVELFDTLLRLGSNIVSFTRLAAFGLTHAVISEVVWDGTSSLWSRGGVLSVSGAVLLFALGNLAAFALGALVGAIQALRLEYYELFSRLFVSPGRPFSPWHVPARRQETS
jgi:V/A-type H+-transporting ATPase subunit I